MSVYLALGANAGDRCALLEKALHELKAFGEILKISSLYETAAVTPQRIPDVSWLRPYLNLAIEFAPHSHLTPLDLLGQTKAIENKLGRQDLREWAPRPVDIDIIYWEDLKINSFDLQIPHPRRKERAFVLDPLKDLCPLRREDDRLILQWSRVHPAHTPSLMAIVNLTPDSFSDGGRFQNWGDFVSFIEKIENSVAYIDLGAESTRPQAQPIDAKTEWKRLAPYLEFLSLRYQNKYLRPKISVDTRHPETMARALEMGANLINDVSGLLSPELEPLFKNSKADFLLMHSLTVPPSPREVLPSSETPIEFLKPWFSRRLEELEERGLSRERIIIDPGIGFGKTPAQNLEILANIQELQSLNCRILTGTSRKSFLRALSSEDPSSVDALSNGVHHFLAKQGVDILRLHDPLSFHQERLSEQQLRSLNACSFHQN